MRITIITFENIWKTTENKNWRKHLDMKNKCNI